MVGEEEPTFMIAPPMKSELLPWKEQWAMAGAEESL